MRAVPAAEREGDLGAACSFQEPGQQGATANPPWQAKPRLKQSRLLLSFGCLWAGVCSGPLGARVELVVSGGGDFGEAGTGYGSLRVLQGNWYGQAPIWETRWHSSFWLCEPSSCGEQGGAGWERQQHSWGW